MVNDLNVQVAAAQQGDRAALEVIVRTLQDKIYYLALRMLVNPDDAFDATQEILILIVTKLSTFKGESAFTTWAHRVGVNYLINAQKSAQKKFQLTFDMFGADLRDGLSDNNVSSPEDVIMLNELRISCTMAMLLCLDLNHRIAYVLGDIMEFEHGEAAEVLNITKANFRKRLSRAREKIVKFTSNNCGLANDNAACSCPRRLPAALSLGRVHPKRIGNAIRDAPAYDEIVGQVKNIESGLKVLKLQRATASPQCPKNLSVKIAKIVDVRT